MRTSFIRPRSHPSHGATCPQAIRKLIPLRKWETGNGCVLPRRRVLDQPPSSSNSFPSFLPPHQRSSAHPVIAVCCRRCRMPPADAACRDCCRCRPRSAARRGCRCRPKPHAESACRYGLLQLRAIDLHQRYSPMTPACRRTWASSAVSIGRTRSAQCSVQRMPSVKSAAMPT